MDVEIITVVYYSEFNANIYFDLRYKMQHDVFKMNLYFLTNFLLFFAHNKVLRIMEKLFGYQPTFQTKMTCAKASIIFLKCKNIKHLIIL